MHSTASEKIEDRQSSADTLEPALRVLSAARDSLQAIHHAYEHDWALRERLNIGINTIARSNQARGKVILSGVGKSGHIAQKLSATANSLGLDSTYLHPTEALHGDLGCLRENDVFILISNSGKTPELQDLLLHVHESIPVILICGTPYNSSLEMPNRAVTVLSAESRRDDDVLGIPVPTASALAALVVGDALILSTAQRLHGSNVSSIFYRNHPAGAIGARLHREARLHRAKL